MPATVNLLGAPGEPDPDRGGPARGAPELGYALFEIGEVDEASTVLADAERAPALTGDRRANGASPSRARASRCTGTPRG